MFEFYTRKRPDVTRYTNKIPRETDIRIQSENHRMTQIVRARLHCVDKLAISLYEVCANQIALLNAWKISLPGKSHCVENFTAWEISLPAPEIYCIRVATNCRESPSV